MSHHHHHERLEHRLEERELRRDIQQEQFLDRQLQEQQSHDWQFQQRLDHERHHHREEERREHRLEEREFRRDIQQELFLDRQLQEQQYHDRQRLDHERQIELARESALESERQRQLQHQQDLILNEARRLEEQHQQHGHHGHHQHHPHYASVERQQPIKIHGPLTSVFTCSKLILLVSGRFKHMHVFHHHGKMELRLPDTFFVGSEIVFREPGGEEIVYTVPEGVQPGDIVIVEW